MQKTLKLSAVACAVLFAAGCNQDSAAQTSFAPQAQADYADRNQNGKMDRYEDTSAPVADRVNDIISRLSLDQKIKLVIGTGFTMSATGGSEKVPGAAGSTFAIPELGIPGMVLSDGPAGLRIQPTRENDDNTYYATAFPVATVLASTWNKALLTDIGEAMGEEVKEYGVDLFLAPGMNIHYNPMGGRNFEYYSEDPYLSGHMAAAIVNGVESHGVGTTIKHFVANSAESSRMWLDAHINERAVREIYLRGFEIAVKEAQPWAIMTSYNKLNGTYTSQDEKLLQKVLRDEWGFDGLVMTDWFAGDNAAAQMAAGNDLIMPGVPEQHQQIKDAVQKGELEESVLDRNLRRILAVTLSSPSYNHYKYSDKPDLKGHADIARTAAAEGVVLLKNNSHTLPLTGVHKVAAFGNTSYQFIAGGTGSGDVNEAYTISLVDGLANSKLAVNAELKSAYEKFMQVEKAKQPPKKSFFDLLPPIAEYMPEPAILKTMAEQNDVAFVTIGRNSGEFYDRKEQGDFNLTEAEQTLIDNVTTAFHAQNKPVIAILNIGNVIETASWRDKVDSIVLPWQGGQEAGNALVDVLTGKVSPSGKLPTTFPLAYSDNPSSAAFPGFATSDEKVKDPFIGVFEGQESQLDYTDGVYVGYRYYDTFNVDTAYEFGYGLSYTSFEFNNMKAEAKDAPGHYTVSATVKNIGETAGKEVGQLYISAPQTSLQKPEKELKGFAKTALLQPGESVELIFEVTPKQLASFNSKKSAWIADAGNYTLQIAASSEDIRGTATITLAKDLIVEKTATVLAPATPVKEITPKQ